MKNANILLQVLNGQLGVCCDFLTLSHEKTDVLVAGDMASLDAIVRAEQTLLMKMESFDRKRDILMTGEQLRHVTIGELINKHIGAADRAAFQDMYDRLCAAVGQMQKVNELNERLLKQRLSFVDFLLSGAKQGAAASAYAGEAAEATGPRSKRL